MPEACDSIGDDIVVVGDYFVSTPQHDSASLRLVHLMAFLAQRFPVVLMPVFASRPDPTVLQHLTELGIGVVSDPRAQDRFLADHGARVRLAFLSRPRSVTRFLGAVREHAPRAVVVYDTVDLHHHRLRRQAEVAERELWSDRFRLRAEEASTRALEAYLASVCDVTVAVSKDDADGVREIAPGADVRVISNVHPAKPRGDQPATTTIGFLGHYAHSPNVDAMLWFVDRIFPQVLAQVPEAVLQIVGAGAPPELLARQSPHVQVLGWMGDLDQVIAKTAVGIAPLRFGAGVKGKVGEMARRGVPVVTTSIGVQGMDLRHGIHVLVADDEEGFARHVVELLANPNWAHRLGQAASQQVGVQFGAAMAARELDRLL